MRDKRETVDVDSTHMDVSRLVQSITLQIKRAEQDHNLQPPKAQLRHTWLRACCEMIQLVTPLKPCGVAGGRSCSGHS